VTEPSPKLLEELFEYIRIPSISSGGGDPADLMRCAEWVKDKIVRSGGTAEVISDLGNPLVIGELKAADPAAPTIIIYGHYDVQSPDPIDAWTTPPFEPEIRDGRIYARGASDDKGNFYPVLFAACELAMKGELPVNVRCMIEGEEEVGGTSAMDWLAADEKGADAAIVFDSDMLDATTPAITLGVRGIIAFAIDIRVAVRDLHSGMYGGVALNAAHVAQQMLQQVLPGPDGILRDELRAGIIPPTKEELESWAQFAPGTEVIAEAGGRPIDDQAALHYYERNWGDTSLDINGIASGDAVQKRTIVPATAKVKFTIRLAPGQNSDSIAKTTESLLRDAIPEGASVDIEWEAVDAAVFDPKNPALLLGFEALEEATGTPPALQRVGGSIPVLKGFYDRKIPTILSGFALASDGVHAVDESFRLESLALCEAAAYKLFEKLANLR
jgi:acetylornithine deacetylase/succinyl-diaminopimelate desuccinylase-like protein